MPDPYRPSPPAPGKTPGAVISAAENLSESTASAVGALLQNQRRKMGLSLEHVASELRIRLSYLEALEKGNFKALPGLAYASGFLRAYAAFLRLDGVSLVKKFQDEASAAARQLDLHLPQPDPESTAPGSRTMTVAAAVLVLVCVLWYALSDGDRELAEFVPSPPGTETEQVAQPAPSTETAVADTPAIPTGDPALLSPLPATLQEPPPAHTSRVMIRAQVDSWIEIRDTAGRQLFSGIMKVGEIRPVPEMPRAVLTTGNAGGIALSVDGHDLPSLGPRGKVVRNIPLDADTLKQKYGTQVTP
ncbi:MAG: DUF4115 domain-containing protein [Pseudomonadota bacterium]|nr:DUF4115 domain-containing protein [Pseudomonadota bacterium]